MEVEVVAAVVVAVAKTEKKRVIMGHRSVRSSGGGRGEGGRGKRGRTYGQKAVLFPVLPDLLFCDGHRFRRVRLWLCRLWRVARAVCLWCDIGGESVCHGWERGRRRATRR